MGIITGHLGYYFSRVSSEDLMLADRGFNVKETLAYKKASLEHPSVYQRKSTTFSKRC